MNKKEKRAKEVVKGIICKVMVGTAILNVYAGNVLAKFGDGQKDMTGNITSGTKKLVAAFGYVLGVPLMIYAIYSIVLANRNEDSEGRNKGLLNLVTGGALTAMGTIVTFFIK